MRGIAVRTFAVVLAVIALMAGSSPASAHRGRWYWTDVKVVNTISGHRITVEGKRMRIRGDLVTCQGEGRFVRRRGTRQWKHFQCILANPFPGGGVIAGPDALFRVHVVGERRFVVSSVRFVD